MTIEEHDLIEDEENEKDTFEDYAELDNYTAEDMTITDFNFWQHCE